MNVQSLTHNNAFNDLYGNYNINEKADGMRSELFIYNKNIYLLSSNMEMLLFSNKVDKKILDKYNKTVLDGEYIYNEKNKCHVFMSFDLTFYKGEDIRGNNFYFRNEKMMNVMKDIGLDLSYLESEVESKSSLEDLLKFHKIKIGKYLKILNNYVKKDDYVIFPKNFMNLSLKYKSEAFSYTKLITDIYKKNILDHNYPYELDGVIYTPVGESYSNNIKLPPLKWKEPDQNTIDFYIEFKRQKMGYLILYMII